MNSKIEAYKPIQGYQGFIKRVEADNIFGVTYQTAVKKSTDSMEKLNYWKKYEASNVGQSLPMLKKASWK